MKFSKSLIASLATGVLANPFTLIAIDSGTDLQNAAVNANDLTLALFAPMTVSQPPAGFSAASYTNTTSFVLEDDGSLFMNIGTTGVQIVYVAPQTGLVRITPGHTDYIPDAGISNFTINGSHLEFHDPAITPWACGAEPGPFRIEFNFPALDTSRCREIALHVLPQDTTAPGAWQYV